MLSDRVRTVLDLVADLSDEERRQLRDELDGTPAPSQEDWDRTWSDELSRRIADVEDGTTSLVDGDEVLADLRADLAS